VLLVLAKLVRPDVGLGVVLIAEVVEVHGDTVLQEGADSATRKHRGSCSPVEGKTLDLRQLGSQPVFWPG
jgi:hypothetical protein